MAQGGRAPKEPEQRRTRHVPQRGEWLDLPAENTNRPPAMPSAPKGGWSTGSKSAWRSWWRDPVSLLWSPADREALRAVVYLHHEVERGKLSVAPEVRLRLDLLGLSQKGKRDLRWRVVADELEPKRDVPVPAAERRQNLKVV